MEHNTGLSTNQRIVIATGFVLVIILSSILTFSLSVFIMQLILGTITLYFCFITDYKTAKLYLCIFSISLIFVFLVFQANTLYYGEPYYIGGSDDLVFEELGQKVYSHGIYNPSKAKEYNIIRKDYIAPAFPVYIAFLIRFAEIFDGYSTYLPRIANAYYLVWICMIVKYLLARYTRLSDKKIRYSLGFFAFMPNIQYINSHVFRDTINLLQVLLIILLFDLLIRKNHYKLKIFGVVCLPFLIYFTYHTRVNSLLFAGVTIVFIISKVYSIKKRYILTGILLLLIFTDFAEIIRLRRFIETYSRYVSNLAGDGLSSYVFNLPMLPLGIFFRALYALLSPFPSVFGLFEEKSRILFDIVKSLVNLGVLVQILFVPFIIRRSLKLDWLSLVFLSWFLPVIVTTFTFRHFLLFYPFMSALAIDGFVSMTSEKRDTILKLSLFTIVSLGIIYVVLKMT